MRARKPTVVLAVTTSLHLSLLGCMELRHADDAGTGCPSQDLSSPLPDLAAAAPKCAAAKGLSGDNVLCVDFDKITQLNDPSLADWKFNQAMSGNCTGWQISSGKLQVNMYSTLAGNCGITMPAVDLKLPANQKYQVATLSIVQTIELAKAQQHLALIYVVSDNDDQQLWATTGKNARQQLTISVTKSDIPINANSVFQPFLKMVAPATGGALQGWKIESIAVNLSQ